jgi:hypothetical protein
MSQVHESNEKLGLENPEIENALPKWKDLNARIKPGCGARQKGRYPSDEAIRQARLGQVLTAAATGRSKEQKLEQPVNLGEQTIVLPARKCGYRQGEAVRHVSLGHVLPARRTGESKNIHSRGLPVFARNQISCKSNSVWPWGW